MALTWHYNNRIGEVISIGKYVSQSRRPEPVEPNQVVDKTNDRPSSLEGCALTLTTSTKATCCQSTRKRIGRFPGYLVTTK